MCGFVGFTGQIDNRQQVLDAMMDRIVHRGPDMGGSHLTDEVALGFPPPVHPRPHRGGRPAHGQRGRQRLRGLQRRDLQLHGASLRARASRLHLPLQRRHRGSRPRLRGVGGSGWSTACAACTPSWSTTRATTGSSARATSLASSRSTTIGPMVAMAARQPGTSSLAARSRASSSTRALLRRSTTRRSARTSPCSSRLRTRPSLPVSTSCRPRTALPTTSPRARSTSVATGSATSRTTTPKPSTSTWTSATAWCTRASMRTASLTSRGGSFLLGRC